MPFSLWWCNPTPWLRYWGPCPHSEGGVVCNEVISQSTLHSIIDLSSNRMCLQQLNQWNDLPDTPGRLKQTINAFGRFQIVLEPRPAPSNTMCVRLDYLTCRTRHCFLGLVRLAKMFTVVHLSCLELTWLIEICRKSPVCQCAVSIRSSHDCSLLRDPLNCLWSV